MSDFKIEDILSEVLSQIYINCYALHVTGLGEVVVEVTFKDASTFSKLNIERVGYLAAITVFSRDNKVFNGQIGKPDYELILSAATSFIAIKEEANE